jgi:hypothetical protein
MIIAMIGSNISNYSKNIFYNGVHMIAYTIGNFCGPHAFREYQTSLCPDHVWILWCK